MRYWKTALWFLWAGLASASEADLQIENAWVRAPAPGQPNAALYLTAVNRSDHPIRLTAARSPAADRAEFHVHQHAEGMMRMRRVDDVLIAAGDQMQFKPHGHHLMLLGIKAEQLASGVQFCVADESGAEWCAVADLTD